MKRIFILILFLLPLTCLPQARADHSLWRDSLRRLMVSKNLADTTKAWNYYRIAVSFDIDHPDSILYYSEKAKKESERINYKKGVFNALIVISEVRGYQGKKKEQLDYCFQVLKLAESENNKEYISMACFMAGNAYSELNILDKAIIYYKKALDIARQINLLDIEFKIMSNLAVSYSTSGDYQKAIDLYKPLISQLEKSKFNDPMAYAAALHNLAQAQQYLHLFPEALQNYLRAVEINKKADNKNFLQTNLIQIGDLYLADSMNTLRSVTGDNRSHLDIALSYLNEVKAMGELLKDTMHLINTYDMLSQVYLAKKDPATALRYGLTGWKLYRGHERPEAMKESQGNLGNIYFALGNYKAAAALYKRQSNYNDSVRKAEAAEKIAILGESYEVEQRNEQLKEKDNQLRETRFITYLIIGLAGLFLVLSVLVFIFFLQKRRTAIMLDSKNKEIVKARLRAEQSEKFKERFLASMSHEIRTPLNAVIGMTGLLLDSKHDPKTEQYLKTIKQAGEHLTGIINDILDLSKIEAGKLDLNESPFSLESLKEEINGLFEIRAREKNLQLIVTREKDVPDWVNGDIGRIRQVLVNLTGNALKFTEKGSVSIRFSSAGKREDKDLVQFSVEDTGPGIPKEEQAIIFEEFIQTSQHGELRVAGTGLGLSISRKLADRLGGTLTVESEPGRGSVFSFSIPLPRSSKEAFEKLQSEKEKSVLAMNGSYRILVAEDNPSNQIVILGMLEKILPESVVMMAEDGNQAVEMLKKERFDLVLMDVQMPFLDGYAATQKLRGLANENALVPVIALTASVIRSDIRKCLDAGMNAYVPKPVSRNLLARTIREQLQVPDAENTGPVTPDRIDFLEKIAQKQLWAGGLAEICNGKKERFISYLEIFISETGKQTGNWDQWINGNHVDELARSLHKLIPYFKLFGEENWYSATIALESELRQTVPPDFREKIQTLKEVLERMRAEAAGILQDLK